MKIKNVIISRKLRREMTQPEKGLIKATATFKEIE